MPKRIQLKRTKGWKMPPNTVKVDRTTKWGNPFRIWQSGPNQWLIRVNDHVNIPKGSKRDAEEGCCRLYRAYLDNDGSQPGAIRDAGGAMLKILAKEELRGKDLACWCREGSACHADILLEIANS